MFTQREIAEVRNLVDDTSAEDVLDNEEREIMVNKNLLCDGLFVSKNQRLMVLKKLVLSGAFDMLTLVEDINSALRPPYEIRIGLYFIVQKKNIKTCSFSHSRPRSESRNKNGTNQSTLREIFCDLLNIRTKQQNPSL